MKNKSTTDLRLVNILLIFGTSVALLVSSSSQMISASVEGGTPGPNTSNSNQSAAEGCSPMDPRCNTEDSCELDPYKCAGQSQGSSQDVGSGSNTSNSNQGTGSANKCTVYNPCGPEDQPNNADNSCVTDPNKCKPSNNAEQSQGGSQGGTPNSSSSGASSNSNQQAIDHINQAQSAMQNGDTEGAQGHLDLAKQALGHVCLSIC